MASPACQHHPAEAAVGICIGCRAPLCDVCITKVDGINHCRTCLLARAAERPAGSTHPRGETSAPLVWLSLGLGVAALAALAWTTLTAVLPAGAP